MSKGRDIEILTYKIAELDKKIKAFEANGVSHKKTENLKLQKLKYEDDLAEIQLG